MKNLFIVCVMLVLTSKVVNSSFKGLRRITNLNESFHGTEISESLKDLLNWVKGSPEPLYVIPPNDKEFYSFRFLSKKAIWGTVHDINQLAYSPDFYLKGIERLRVLGFEPLGHLKFSFKYDLCSLSMQKEISSLPIVIRKGAIECLQKFKVEFQNKDFMVVKVK